MVFSLETEMIVNPGVQKTPNSNAELRRRAGDYVKTFTDHQRLFPYEQDASDVLLVLSDRKNAANILQTESLHLLSHYAILKYILYMRGIL